MDTITDMDMDMDMEGRINKGKRNKLTIQHITKLTNYKILHLQDTKNIY
jgi:hypothetical protein